MCTECFGWGLGFAEQDRERSADQWRYRQTKKEFGSFSLLTQFINKSIQGIKIPKLVVFLNPSSIDLIWNSLCPSQIRSITVYYLSFEFDWIFIIFQVTLFLCVFISLSCRVNKGLNYSKRTLDKNAYSFFLFDINIVK